VVDLLFGERVVEVAVAVLDHLRVSSHFTDAVDGEI
jgi:hypothetical protein